MTEGDDEQALLGVLAAVPEPVGMYDAVTALNPDPPERESRAAWRTRQGELIDAFLRLYQRGLVREAVSLDGGPNDRYVLTVEGRAAVAARGRAGQPPAGHDDRWTAD